MVLEKQTFKVAEVELVYKTTFNVETRPKLSRSEDCYKTLIEHWNMNTIELQEEFKIILLNTANRVLAMSTVSQGGLAGTVVDVRFIFATAIKLCASGLVLAHNHPSGNLKPSEHDLRTTVKLVEGGKLLDIKILDHLIVSRHGYYSFGDNGII